MSHLPDVTALSLGAAVETRTSLWIIAAGVFIRQVDRWWFSPARGDLQVATLRQVMALQRARANDITPVLLLAGHWLEVLGWWVLATHSGPIGWAAVATATAVKMRHLQEVTHFAVHGVLVRHRTFGVMLAEVAVHAPLGLVPMPERQDAHVRRHHPNATVTGVDPNLAELAEAGFRHGVGRLRFTCGVLYRLTWRGLTDTLQAITAGLRPRRAADSWRVSVFTIMIIIAALVGWPALVFGYAVPRLLLYPELAWLSLLVEHRWFDPDPEPVTGSRAEIEAARCVRLYPRNRMLAPLARVTWLPYGDLFSAHPSVRWNYLPALERNLGMPARTPVGLLFGHLAVLPCHWHALAAAERSASG